jgi:prepilin-type N-terminal cleavage/methylation domain-containing protein
MEKRMNQAMRNRHAGQRGFTLIELLVVIAVLAVLAAVVVFNVTGVKDKGTAAACSTDVKSAQSAVDAYLNEASTNTIVTADLTGTWSKLVPAFLHTVPSSCGTFAVGANNTVTGAP